MGPVCKICTKLFMLGEKFYSTLCGHVYHRECIKKHLEVTDKCPTCEKVAFPSQLKRIWFRYSTNELEFIEVIKKKYEDQINYLKKEQNKKDEEINYLKKEQHKKDDQIVDLEKKIQTLNISLDLKCKALAATDVQLKDEVTKLDSKTKDLATCEALLRDQKNLTTNLYDLVKGDLQKWALMSAEDENLRSELECSKARCAELERTIEDHTQTTMKEMTLKQQSKKEVAAFEKEKTVREERILELENMDAKLISSKVIPTTNSEIFSGQKRELKDESAIGINESHTKRIKVGKNTKQNVPTSQRILRSSNQNTLQKV